MVNGLIINMVIQRWLGQENLYKDFPGFAFVNLKDGNPYLLEGKMFCRHVREISPNKNQACFKFKTNLDWKLLGLNSEN